MGLGVVRIPYRVMSTQTVMREFLRRDCIESGVCEAWV